MPLATCMAAYPISKFSRIRCVRYFHLYQIALVDIMADMGVTPDGMVGHSVGELGCAYADGAMTSEETLFTAYWRGRCVEEANLQPGAMAAVGE